MPRAAFFVQSCPGREAALAATCTSLDASDVGEYEVCCSGQPTRAHALATLARMAECDADMVVRLEDDVAVAKHIRHNVETWPETSALQFGAGWLFASGGGRTIVDYIYQRSGTSKWLHQPTAYSQAILFWRRDLPAIIEACEQCFAERPGTAGQDLAISAAVLRTGKKICVHVPSQVEHLVQFGSALGNCHDPLHATTRGEFQQFAQWKRS